MLDVMLMEAEKIIQHFFQMEHKEIEKVVIGGGTALLPGLQEYVRENLKKETEIADPFRSVFYPPILEQTMKTAGAAYAVAIGVAMRELT
ncbi:MAG: pilus assembly protein PilM [Candidatus Wildermuthbacteria bacterium]|nr:pilus assembly protein PilM [Candidatus Wildermuthbacteria bacterium]